MSKVEIEGKLRSIGYDAETGGSIRVEIDRTVEVYVLGLSKAVVDLERFVDLEVRLRVEDSETVEVGVE